MFRRTLVITVVAVALSAAAAFAFAPSLARAGHGWSLSGLWAGRGFTPDPQAHNPLNASGDVVLQNGDGTPGTYCPIPARNQSAPAASQATATDPAFESGASTVDQSKPDLLQPPAAANCAPPPQSSSASRAVLP